MTKQDLVNQSIELLRNNEKFIKAELTELSKTFKGLIDVRLGIDLSDSGMSVESYSLMSGDSSYDQVHYPICGATVIDTRVLKDKYLDDVFEDLLNQCLDQAAEMQR